VEVPATPVLKTVRVSVAVSAAPAELRTFRTTEGEPEVGVDEELDNRPGPDVIVAVKLSFTKFPVTVLVSPAALATLKNPYATGAGVEVPRSTTTAESEVGLSFVRC